MGNRNKNRNRQQSSTESKMDDTKPQEQGAGTDAGAVGTANAPAVDNNGIADQSQQASDAVQPGTTTAEPESGADAQSESAGAGAEGSGAAETPQPVIETPPPVQTIATPPPEAPAAKIETPPAPPAPVAPVAPVAAVKPVVQETPASSEGGLTPYEDINRIVANVPKAKLALIHFLMEYARDMAPRRPIPEAQGAAYQVNLYRQLHVLINKEDEHFRELFTAVLMFFKHEASRCFAASHAFRFQENIKLNPDERASFNSLIDMLRLLGPTEGRDEAGKQVSIKKALAKNMTDTGRNRVISYFDGQFEIK